MKIKTYTAPQLAEALAQIKRELGEEALILSTKEVELQDRPGAPSIRGFEVVAASDIDDKVPTPAPSRNQTVAPPITAAARNAYKLSASKRKLVLGSTAVENPQPLDPAKVERRPESSKLSESKASAAEPVHPAASSSPTRAQRESDDFNDYFCRELRELKRLVRWSAQSVPGARLRIADQEADALFVEMIANDLDESLARRIVAEAQEQCRLSAGKWTLENSVRRILQEMITVQPISEEPNSRIVAAFLGPTGVGKTTTIAKLASRFALELGKRVLLITLDTFRIGAAEQLKIYAELIDVPLLVVSQEEELARALQDNREMEVILIDTVGRAHNRLESMSSLAEFLRGDSTIQKHLVLSLTTKPLDLHQIINAFQIFGINRLLFTKLDETLTSGAAANELIRARIPLSYVTNGQNVPQDIQIPTPSSFVENIVAREIPEEVIQAYA